MRWVLAAAALCLLLGEILAVHARNAVILEQSGGLVSICAALGAVHLLLRAPQISDSERRLGDLGDLVSPDRAHELVIALQRKDRLDQLLLIVLSAVGAALQAFAGAALDLGLAVVGALGGH